MVLNVQKIRKLLSTLPGKISLLIFTVILVLVFAIDVFAVAISTSILRQNLQSSISTSVFQSGKYFDQILERAKDLSFQLATNETIQKYLNVQRTSTDDYEKLDWKKNAQKALLSIVSANKFLSSIYILVDKETSLGYPTISFENIDFKKLMSSSWAKAAIESDQGFVWCSNHNQYFNDVLKEVGSEVRDYATSVVRVLYDSSSGNRVGLIVVDIGRDVFDEMLSNVKVTKNSTSFVITPDGFIILPTNINEKLVKNLKALSAELLKKAEKKEIDNFELNMSGRWLVSYSKSPDSSFLYVSLIPISDINSKTVKLQIFIIMISLIFGILGIVSGLIVTLKITKNVKILLESMSKAANGNLTMTTNISSNDEIGMLSDGFNSMVQQLKELITKIKQLSEKVNKSISLIASVATETTAASHEVTKAVSEIAEGASQQANEATAISQQMAEFTKEISVMVNDFKSMNQFSENVLIQTNKGFSAIEMLHQVARKSQETTKNMIFHVRELIGWTEKIGKIMNLLSSISEQTKLLALNASIEAAKAGEVGRGFSVVATEIRKLAQQSRESTKDVEDIIKNILSKAKFSDKVAADVENLIGLQENALDNVQLSFDAMKNAISELYENLRKSLNVLEDIDYKKDRIFNSVESISAISEETAASAEEVSAATEQQLASIEELKNMIEELRKLSVELDTTTSRFITEN
ncbi:methyl-accepting chemotaxis protein [Caldicellulosiruptor acetigenus]|uniref:methyl-accepting chemotaxis protein n=1 Tax=Caldicellulosiruptor acetigenus TaxID=301953 RepID=UPI0004049286|nr:methyl-accepting chemotaxis protein [Caldicellulosiruptor acetigenus]WAM36656.1 methyl-accepting chemotaxis protein [Caldicellulosiruptor acetigenus]